MSDVAKDRLLGVGARFASYEHANARPTKDLKHNVNTMPVSSNQNMPAEAHGKMSFWKKNSGKVPGR